MLNTKPGTKLIKKSHSKLQNKLLVKTRDKTCNKLKRIFSKTFTSKPIFVVIAFLGIISLILPNFVFADVSSPMKQMRLGISQDEVICKQNLFKVVKAGDGRPFCVKPDTAKRLSESGWAVSVDESALTEFTNMQKDKKPVGTLKTLSIVKETLDPGRLRTNPLISSYMVIFEVCSADKQIRAPEVIVSSDSETKYVKLVEMLPPNTCQTNGAQIKASNMDSITLKLTNSGGITQKILSLENKVENLKAKLLAETSKLTTKGKTDEQKTQPLEQGLMTKISDLRKELNTAKEELNRYLFAANLSPKIRASDIDSTAKSFAGTPLTSVVVNKLSTSKQLQVEGGYDVVFEICAGSQMIRVPSVMISSDMESKNVRMADKIAPNTCQVSGAKILAGGPDIIEVTSGETIKKSAGINNMEKKITELQKSIQAEKQKLRDLTHLAPKPADFEKQATMLVQKIIDLRAEIQKVKATLYDGLNKIYQ